MHQQLEQLTDAYLRAVIPLDEYERRRRDLEQRVGALAKQEEQLRDDAERQRQLAGLAASLEAFRERVQRGLAQATFEQRRQLALLLIDRVVVTDAEVEIRYVLPTSPESEHVRFCHLRKDYFHHPAARENDEALLAGKPLDDVVAHAMLVRPFLTALGSESSIEDGFAQARPFSLARIQGRQRVAILKGGGDDGDGEPVARWCMNNPGIQ
jgi:site-specific DNA recombinase